MTGDGTTDPTAAGDPGDPDIAEERPAAGPTGGLWDRSDTSGGVLALRPLSDLGEPVDPDACPAESDCSDWGQLIDLRDFLDQPTKNPTEVELAAGPDDRPDADDLARPPGLDPPPPGPGSPPGPTGSPNSSAETVLSRLRSRPLVELVVPYDLLAGGRMPGEVNRTGLIPADVLTRLLAQAEEPSDWCLTTVDPSGRVITHSRTKHDPTAAHKRFVSARDRMCTFPGCPRRAARCDIDHRVPWEKGGPTCPCNLHPLCRRHHRIKQADGWQITRDPATGTTRWTTPHGVIGPNDTDTLDPHLHQQWTNPPGEDDPPGHTDPPGDTDPPAHPPATAA